MHKKIKGFAGWVGTHSPGSSFEFVANVYKTANCHRNLVHTRKRPQLVREGDYEVTLEQYGHPANPRTLHVVSVSCALLKPYFDPMSQQQNTHVMLPRKRPFGVAQKLPLQMNKTISLLLLHFNCCCCEHTSCHPARHHVVAPYILTHFWLGPCSHMLSAMNWLATRHLIVCRKFRVWHMIAVLLLRHYMQKT